jgi:hypothetical protein
MVRLRFELGLIFVLGGCTANAGSSSGEPDKADAVAERTTASVSDGGNSTRPDEFGGSTSPSEDTGTNTNAAPSSEDVATADEATGILRDAGASTVSSCDTRKLTCKRSEPSCDYGYVPRIVDGCYAECVRIDDCVCNGPDACPQHDRYTCNNSRQRCTPYLN